MDGRSEYAGAVVDGGTSSRVRAAGLDLDTSLRGFDTSTALAASGDVLRTGSTGTNVGDVLVAACSPG
jgi:hydroxypyruvate reductase